MSSKNGVNIVAEKGSQMLQGITLGGVITHGFNAFNAIGDYKRSRENGSSKTGAVVSAGAQFVIGEMLGAWTLPFYLAPQIPALAVKGAEAIGKTQRSMARQSRNTPFANATFNDHTQAFTMRQAGMKLAEASRYNLQHTLMGNEASMLRR